METKVSKFDKRYFNIGELNLPCDVKIGEVTYEMKCSSEDFNTKPATISFVEKYGNTQKAIFSVNIYYYNLFISSFGGCDEFSPLGKLLNFVYKNASFYHIKRLNNSIQSLVIRQKTFLDEAKKEGMSVQKYLLHLEKQEAKKIKEEQKRVKNEIEVCKKFIKKYGKMFLYEERVYTGSKRHKKFAGVEHHLSATKTRHNICFEIGKETPEFLQKNYYGFVNDMMLK